MKNSTVNRQELTVLGKSGLCGAAVVVLAIVAGTASAAAERTHAVAAAAHASFPEPATYILGLLAFAMILVFHAKQVAKRNSSDS